MKTNGTNGYGYALIRLFTKTVDRLDLAHEPQFAHTWCMDEKINIRLS